MKSATYVLLAAALVASTVGRAQEYPPGPAADRAILGRGRALYSVNCAFCNGADASALQQMWLMPTAGRGRGGAPLSNVPPTTATVTLPSGQTVTGRLRRIDDFLVTLEQADGTSRSFTRTGDSPKVEIADPLKPHRDLLPKYTDKEIHDITAYLVTLK